MNVVFLSQTHPLGFKIFHKPVTMLILYPVYSGITFGYFSIGNQCVELILFIYNVYTVRSLLFY